MKAYDPATQSYRFQTFSQRIAAVDVDVLHRLRRTAGDDASPETDSFFHDELLYWAQLCLVTEFRRAVSRLLPLCETLPMLLFNKQRVFEILNSAIAEAPTLALEPLLKVLTALSRDLRGEFYEFFIPAVQTLVERLDARDPVALEHTFQALLFLFKFLLRQIVQDLPRLFAAYSAFFSHDKEYVRQFAAESFSFLMRKVKGPALADIVAAMFAACKDSSDPNLVNGVAGLLAATVKGVKKHFHSRMPDTLPLFLDAATDAHLSGDHNPVPAAVRQICEHGTRATVAPVLGLLVDFAAAAVAARNKRPDRTELALTHAFQYIAVAVGAGAVADATRIARFVAVDLPVEVAVELPEAVLGLVATLVTAKSTVELSDPDPDALVAATVSRFEHKATEAVFGFAVDLAASPHCAMTTFDVLARFCVAHLDAHPERSLRLLLALAQQQGASSDARLTVFAASGVAALYTRILAIFGARDLTLTWLALHATRVLPLPAKAGVAKKLAARLEDLLQSPGLADNLPLRSMAARAFFPLLASREPARLAAFLPKEVSFLVKHCQDPCAAAVMEAAAEFLDCLASSDSTALTEDMGSTMATQMLPCLSARDRHVRALAVRLVRCFPMPEPAGFLRQAAEIMDAEWSPLYQRSIIAPLESFLGQLHVLSPQYRAMVVHICLGVFSIKLSTVWPTAAKVLAGAVKAFPNEAAPIVVAEWIRAEEAVNSLEPPAEGGDQRRWTEPSPVTCSLADACAPPPAVCTTPAAYFAQLCRALQACPGAVKRSAKMMMESFFRFIDRELRVVYAIESTDDTKGSYQGSRRIVREKLQALMHVLSAAPKPRNLPQAERYWDTLLELLAMSDSEIQQLALGAMYPWQLSYLTPYKDFLDKLVDDESMRSAMAQVPLGVHATEPVIKDMHRAELIPVIIRILYGKMRQRRRAGTGKHSLAGLRAAVFAYLNGLSPDEIGPLVALTTTSFQDLDALPALSIRLGFVHSVHDIIKQIGHVMVGNLGALVAPLLAVLQAAIKMWLETPKTATEAEAAEIVIQQASARQIRRAGLETMALLFRRFGSTTDLAFATEPFFEIAAPLIERMPRDNTQRPTGVLRCLLAMSRHAQLQPWLTKDRQVLSQTLALLSAPLVDQGVVGAVIEIVANLLREPEQVKPHMSELVHHLCTLMLAEGSRFRTQKYISSRLAQRVLWVLTKASEFSPSADDMQAITSLLLPYLDPRLRVRTESRVLILELLARSIGMLSNRLEFFPTLSRLFQHLEERECREALTSVMQAYAQAEPALLGPAGDLISDLNSFSESEVGVPDYDRRLAAYSAFNDSHCAAMTYEQLLPVVNSLLFDIKLTDLSLRSNAGFCLQGVVKSVGAREAAAPERQRLLDEEVLPAVRYGLSRATKTERQELLRLLSETVALPGQLPDLKPLYDPDPEANFFVNITHIQVNRRARAMARLRMQVDADKFSRATIWSYFVPIVMQLIYDETENDQNLLNETTQTIGPLAARLSWTQYRQVLLRLITMFERLKAHQRLVIRAVCLVIDEFREVWRDGEEEAEEEADEEVDLDEEEEGNVDKMDEDDDDDDANDDDDDDDDDDKDHDPDASAADDDNTDTPKRTTPLAKHPINLVSFSLVPKLFRLLESAEDNPDLEAVRTPLALGIARLVRLLPEDVQEQRLHRLLLIVCNTLRSRSQVVRDVARRTLAQLATYLGAGFLAFIVDALQTSLHSGYQVHVLGFTVHYLLVQLEASLEVGQIDDCAEAIVGIALEELYGDTAAAKEYTPFASKMRESKASRGIDSLEILARWVNPVGTLDLVLAPLVERIHTQIRSVKAARQMRDVLRALTRGIASNKLTDSKAILLVAYRILRIHLQVGSLLGTAAASSKRKSDGDVDADAGSAGAGKKKLRSGPGSGSNVQKAADSYLIVQERKEVKGKAQEQLLVEFALQLVITVLKWAKLDANKQSDLELLDPFVGSVRAGMRSKHEEVASKSLLALGLMAKYPLPSLQLVAEELLMRIFVMLRRGSNSSDLTQMCFKTLTAVIRDNAVFRLTKEQMQVVIGYIGQDLDDYGRQGTAFALLRAIIERKLVSPEVYDLAVRLGEIMVKAQAEHVQNTCSKILITFLLDYPLSGARLQQHLQFLLQNTTYEHISGRSIVLTTLHAVIKQFPDVVVNEYASFFLLPLATAMVNDSAKAIREQAAGAIGALFDKMDAERLRATLVLLEAWSGAEAKLLLQRMAMQVCGVALGAGAKIGPQALPLIGAVLERGLDRSQSHDDRVAGWERVYYALFALDRVPTELVPADMMIAQVGTALGHPHAWVRSLSCRLFGQFLTDGGGARMAAEQAQTLAWKHFDQLSGAHLTEPWATQIVKNLVELMAQTVASPKFGTLIGRLSDLGRSGTGIQRTFVFKLFAAAAMRLSEAELAPHLERMLLPMYKLTTVPKSSLPEEKWPLVDLAEEVMSLMQERMPGAAYVGAVAAVQKHVTDLRKKRKQDRAFEMVLDPEAAAQRKVRKHELKEKRRKERRQAKRKYRPEEEMVRLRVKPQAEAMDES